MTIIVSTYYALFYINCSFKKLFSVEKKVEKIMQLLYVTARVRATLRAVFTLDLILWNRRRKYCKLYNMLLGLTKMCSSVLGLNENPLEPVDSWTVLSVIRNISFLHRNIQGYLLCCNKIVSHMKCEINLGIFISCESYPGRQLPIWEKSMIFLSSIKCALLFCSSSTQRIAVISRPKTAGKLTVIKNCEARAFTCKSETV